MGNREDGVLTATRDFFLKKKTGIANDISLSLNKMLTNVFMYHNSSSGLR